MLRSKKIAITGGMATGKSTVCDFLEQLGSYVIRADNIVNDLLKPGTTVSDQIINLLGRSFVTKGQIDKKKIADIAFSNKDVLKSLEEIIHPVVINEINKKMSKATGKYPCIFVEIPLLFEIGKENYFDYVIVVVSDESICIERLAKKGVFEKEYKQRMLHQINPKIKADKADFIIENNSTLNDLKKKVGSLYHNLLAA